MVPLVDSQRGGLFSLAERAPLCKSCRPTQKNRFISEFSGSHILQDASSSTTLHDELPDDPLALRALLIAQQRLVAEQVSLLEAQRDAILALEQQRDEWRTQCEAYKLWGEKLNRARYGRGSERDDPRQRLLQFPDDPAEPLALDETLDAARDALEERAPAPRKKLRKRAITAGDPSVTARMWAYYSLTAPLNYLDFTVSRHRDGPADVLMDFQGTLLGDRYSGYESIVMDSHDGSNEITAIPQVLDQIDLTNSIMTIDTIGCQKAIMAQSHKAKGTYVIAVKDNQPTLHEAVRDVIHEQLEEAQEDLQYRVHETRDEGHGRVDERSYGVMKVPRNFPRRGEWPSLIAVGYATRVTTNADGTQMSDTRCYILNKQLSGQQFAAAVRGHWAIESMHWVLDVNFREDQHPSDEGTLVNNLSWLRRFAITLLKRGEPDFDVRWS